MKKILISVMLLCAVIAGFSQDSINVDNLTTVNNIPEGNSLWHFDATDSEDEGNLVEATYIQPIFRNGTSLYPRSTSYNLKLGGNSDATAYKLHVTGAGYFSENLYLNNGLYFKDNLSSITTVSGEMYFYDATSGLKKLSDLATSATSINVSNGLSSIGPNLSWGGVLTKTTNIASNGFGLSLGENNAGIIITPAGGQVEINALTTLWLDSEDHLEIDADHLDINAQYAFRLIADGINPNTFYDFTDSQFGLIMPDWLTYWSYILSANRLDAIVTVGGVMDLINDSTGTGAGVGTYIENSSDGKDTIWIPAIVNNYSTRDFDGTDSVDYIPLVIDTLSDNVYLATLAISSANILGGDSLQIVAAPGIGKAIVPMKVALKYEYITSAYISDDATNSAIVKSDEFTNDIADDVFESSSDRYYLGSYSSSATFTTLENVSFWIDFYTHTGSGTGTAILKFWYTIADFN